MVSEQKVGSGNLFDLIEEQRTRAGRLHDEIQIVDGLIAGTYYLDDPEYRDRLPDEGIVAGNLTVGGPSFDFEETVSAVVENRKTLRNNQDNYYFVDSAEDIKSADSGRTGIIFGFQGANWIGDKLERLRVIDELGVRVVDLTYNRGNTLGDGCCEHRDGGLTMLGREAVDLCNELGILLDTSHCNDATTMDIVDRSSKPVIQSHIGCRSLANSQGRAKTDEQLEAVANNDGVNCITPFPPVIKRDPETHKVLPSTISDVLDHIDHAVDVGGVESVAFGGDMSERTLDKGSIHSGSNLATWRKTHPEVYGDGPTDKMDPYPEGLSRYTDLDNLTAGLVARGYSDEAIHKIMGGNLLRVFEEAWH
jgi:membrane dipeptidase